MESKEIEKLPKLNAILSLSIVILFLAGVGFSIAGIWGFALWYESTITCVILALTNFILIASFCRSSKSKKYIYLKI
ncbi:hypothetical protein L3049_14135 [Labilibaculum sp. DW002]|uniref:Uncharacterized protein n=1 Tax=Paralabilibaculum antarcticum TaxID=2912572 RepID=A0ABT5VUQ2_9BACT|nr:hypothetical protein [Labilibaculum sp. DW002]MDE5419135.1 hypothetical protein [Labilibaculum sp. DW002]